MRNLPPDLWPRIKVVHCGLPETSFEQVEGAGGAKSFLCIGRLDVEKGHLVLLEAFARLRANAEQNAKRQYGKPITPQMQILAKQQPVKQHEGAHQRHALNTRALARDMHGERLDPDNICGGVGKGRRAEQAQKLVNCGESRLGYQAQIPHRKHQIGNIRHDDRDSQHENRQITILRDKQPPVFRRSEPEQSTDRRKGRSKRPDHPPDMGIRRKIVPPVNRSGVQISARPTT